MTIDLKEFVLFFRAFTLKAYFIVSSAAQSLPINQKHSPSALTRVHKCGLPLSVNKARESLCVTAAHFGDASSKPCTNPPARAFALRATAVTATGGHFRHDGVITFSA